MSAIYELMILDILGNSHMTKENLIANCFITDDNIDEFTETLNMLVEDEEVLFDGRIYLKKRPINMSFLNHKEYLDSID